MKQFISLAYEICKFKILCFQFSVWSFKFFQTFKLRMKSLKIINGFIFENINILVNENR